MSIIEVCQLCKRYDERVVLDNVDLSIQEGSIHGLLGPNGAGKSTLIRILNKVLKYDSGDVLIDSKPLLDYNGMNIGYLPDERGLYPDCTIESQLLYFAKLKGLSHQTAKQNLKYWLDKFDINSWRNKYINELSKGMQQKVQFVCSVIHKPRILFLDEPFSGFDPLSLQYFQQEIVNLKNEGCTIILSTHDMKSVEDLCDEISFIIKSKVLLTESIESVKQTYSQGDYYEIEYLCSDEMFYEALPSEFKVISISKKNESKLATVGLVENIKWNTDQRVLLFNSLSTKCDAISFQKKEISLHDIFIEVANNKLNK